MDFVDKKLTCIECGAEFVFTADEQVFFHDKQFKNDPKRCKQCKAKRNRGLRKPVRSETQITCAECGSETTFPSNQCRADRCFVANVSRKRKWQADPNRHYLAPCCLFDNPGGGLVHVLAVVFLSHVEIELDREPLVAFR